jgi:hypothetical protein
MRIGELDGDFRSASVLNQPTHSRAMPRQYYADWIGVAAEEEERFTLLHGACWCSVTISALTRPMPAFGTWPK